MLKVSAILIFLGFAFSQPSLTKNGSIRNPSGNKNQYSQNTQNTSSVSSETTLVRLINFPQVQKETKESENTSDKSPHHWWMIPDWWIAGFTFGLLITNGGLILVLLGHLRAFNRQARELGRTVTQMQTDADRREDFDKEHERARIRLIPDDMPIAPQYIGDTVYLRVNCRAINIGRSAAINIDHFNICREIKKWECLNHVRGNYHLRMLSNVVILSGETMVVSTKFVGEIIPTFILTQSQYSDIRDGKNNNRLFFFGYVRFEDVFGRKWSQEYTWEVAIEKGDTFRVTPTNYGNPQEVEITNWTSEDSKKSKAAWDVYNNFKNSPVHS